MMLIISFLLLVNAFN